MCVPRLDIHGATKQWCGAKACLMTSLFVPSAKLDNGEQGLLLW